jgi:RNA polymerase sigma-70 factor, ECF subfamily
MDGASLHSNLLIESLWGEYSARLNHFLRGRVSDPAEAEDLLQEVFIRVHQHLCCLPGPEKMDSWLYQIARNLVIDHYRRRKDWAEIPESLPAEDEIVEEDPQEELALSLREMVDRLPEPYRQALILTEYEGLNQKELAERLGISFSGAKSRVQRARQKLRDLLLACCHFEMDRRGRVMEYYARCCCCAPPKEGLIQIK